MLGGKYHERLRSYTYLYPDPDNRSRRSPFTDPEQAAITAAAYLEQGFTAVKFDPLIDVMGRDDPREPPLDRLDNAEAVVRSVREAVVRSVREAVVRSVREAVVRSVREAVVRSVREAVRSVREAVVRSVREAVVRSEAVGGRCDILIGTHGQPTAPGLGVELDEAVARARAYPSQ